MTKLKYTLFMFLLLISFFKSQVGDNGYPFLYEKLTSENRITIREEYKDNSGNNLPLLQLKEKIKAFETDGVNNQQIIDEVAGLKDKDYINQNIYGKAIYREINIADDNNRIEYDGRYYYLYKVKSSDAKALQIYFKKYLLPKDSKLFLYAENGFILGEFNDKNNPDPKNKGLEFGTQPIPGNTFYIELSYPVDSNNKPLLVTEKVIHSFTDFYGGVYGTAGNCHKNIACGFTIDNKSRNIKSVGLMLYPIYQWGTNTHKYSASCSGNLMNNTAQNGEPYFLTAAHCIGYEAANNNINWSTELITLFNYEALSCTSNGTDAPAALSNNSVFGCTLLTQSPATSLDYALIKLNTTASALAQYKICYAGWDNNPNAYSVNPTNAYSVHHPQGDVKKISIVQELNPVMSNQPILQSGLFGYYAVPWPTNTSGTFLQNSWRNGIVEKGSSGSPLFNSSDRLIGSLSTGPDPNHFNCNNPDIYSNKWFTYYSRFSNNYYTMSPWLNPNGANVQSIGPYCPSYIQVGAPVIVNPGGGGGTQPTNWEEEPIDINGERVHPANTWGKKIYLRENSGTNTQQDVDANFYYYRSVMSPNKNTFAMSENIYNIRYVNINYYVPKLQLWGIYKIVDCNKIKYIKPAKITMRNPGTIGELDNYTINVVGVTDDRVHILIDERRWVGSNGNNSVYNTYELQSYKIINNELVFENYKTFFYQQQNMGVETYYEFDNDHLMLVANQSSVRKMYSCFYSGQNAGWQIDTNPITNLPSNGYTKMVGDKIFMVVPGQNKMNIYNISSNSAALTLQASLSNPFLSTPGGNGILDPIFVFKRSDNIYNVVYKNTNGVSFFELLQVNLSGNSASSSHITMPADFRYVYGVGSNFIIKGNEIIKLTKVGWTSAATSEYGNHFYQNFIKDASGNWIKDKSFPLKWKDVGAFDNRYIISADDYYGNNLKRRMFSIREVDYVAHSYIRYNDNVFYPAAYHRPKKLDNYYFSAGIVVNGREEFKNLTYPNLNFFLYRSPNFGYDFNANTYDTKTVILDDKTQKLTGYKSVAIHGKYSVVMKPGFSVSATTGVEFTAKAQAPLPADIPACSLTFDDMLNPQITETPDETIYLKQVGVKLGNEPYYGEIVLNGTLANQEIVIDRAVKLYPNPTKDILNIDFNGKKFKTLDVYSLDGKKIITKDLSSLNTIQVNLSQYPAGIYMVTLIDSNGKNYPNKIIKK
ncbi:Protease 1 precursor [Chryseobacterium nakagawai]|uniref:T9SS C-terminal target domain-containing protein n=1 Tax=Chryseobacterium nakagawai TaxID=1241982 RepID=A0AAD1DSA0_CHRNA|nr:T9SS type A sorting domain-containing protein [Chryseobacterium nakagawai]AZA92270.1 T9SS C-terminal target domain-containing protein [Chryseobacterium nakagawai]VEH18825.1 Protease 1 precursor [Chryseobacterium nakagawai]